MDPALQAWVDLLRAPGPEIDLALGALTIARLEYPDLIAEHHLKRLDELAERSGARGIGEPLRALHRLREFLFDEEGFRGNADDYHEPANSCLNEVLERKIGIPITLSVLMIEVARRVGLRVQGIGLPGHFVVGARIGDELVLVDPFGGGRVLDRQEAEAIVSRVAGRPVRLTDAHFARASGAQIAVRMLRNLKAIYAKRRDWARTLAAIEGILAVDPAEQAELTERNTVLAQLRRELALLN